MEHVNEIEIEDRIVEIERRTADLATQIAFVIAAQIAAAVTVDDNE